MSQAQECLLSIVVPIYNEENGLRAFQASLIEAIQPAAKESYEIIYCDDGSTDNSAKLVQQWHADDPRIKLLRLSRNFGKEYALSAGIAEAHGQAVMMLDGDGQHPVELIPKFVAAWQAGAQVVIGQCLNRRSESWLKRQGSRVFYRAFSRMTGQKLLPGLTDFRLIDRAVCEAFVSLQETDRVTRGLIDWLGFRRVLIEYEEKSRGTDEASYSLRKLIQLAASSFVSLTPTPLYLFGYLGVVITGGAFVLGSLVFFEQIVLSDPWHWKFTGTAMLGILLLFLVGIVLMSQGILSLYMSHLHNQSKQRPLYVVDYSESAGIQKRTPNA